MTESGEKRNKKGGKMAAGRFEQMPVVWIIRYEDGELWCTGGTKEEALQKAKERRNKEIAAII